MIIPVVTNDSYRPFSAQDSALLLEQVLLVVVEGAEPPLEAVSRLLLLCACVIKDVLEGVRGRAGVGGRRMRGREVQPLPRALPRRRHHQGNLGKVSHYVGAPVAWRTRVPQSHAQRTISRANGVLCGLLKRTRAHLPGPQGNGPRKHTHAGNRQASTFPNIIAPRRQRPRTTKRSERAIPRTRTKTATQGHSFLRIRSDSFINFLADITRLITPEQLHDDCCGDNPLTNR